MTPAAKLRELAEKTRSEFWINDTTDVDQLVKEMLEIAEEIEEVMDDHEAAL